MGFDQMLLGVAQFCNVKINSLRQLRIEQGARQL